MRRYFDAKGNELCPICANVMVECIGPNGPMHSCPMPNCVWHIEESGK